MLTLICALHAVATPHFAVLKHFAIPGDGGWDLMAVDEGAQRLYISRGTHTQVMSTASGKIVADILNTPGVHGIALAPKLGKGFVTNGRDNSVSVIDLKTSKETARVKVGGNPDAIEFDAKSGLVFCMDAGTSDAAVIDAKTNKVVKTIQFEGKPELPVADGKGHVFVNYEDKSMVAEIDVASLSLKRSWSLAPGEGPTGIAMDTKHGFIFSTCDNQVVISDAASAKVVGTAPTGGGTDGAGFDSGLGVAFASNGDGTLSVVAQVGGVWKNVQNVTTKRSARTMAVDQKRHLVYLIAADFEAPAAGQRRGGMKPGSAEIIVVGPAKK